MSNYADSSNGAASEKTNQSTNRPAQKDISYLEALRILKPREIEVLELIGKGHTYKQAAERLTISPHTIHTYVKTIKKKLKVNGYRGLVPWYRKHWDE
ncbi:MAG: hypothetical protein GVY20_14070 [Bacteroidetes bacterium]|nr:hypothetical protein [Bacteroidota bacterium]